MKKNLTFPKGVSILSRTIFASILVFLFLITSSPKGFGQGGEEVCGPCRRDSNSPTGASQFCRFGPGQTAVLPCVLEENVPTPTPPVVNGVDLNLTTADVPVCSSGSVTLFNRIVSEKEEVNGFEFGGGSNVFTYPAERYTNINNWFPLDTQKQTLCGKLQRFSIHDGAGDEMDWNNFIAPNPPYLHLFYDALPYKGGDGFYCIDDSWPTCGSSTPCIEAELTPDESFYENPWFPKSTFDSQGNPLSPLENRTLQGPTVCTYGPWVRECFHGHKPEIHPSELVWWREQPGAQRDMYWLIQAQDDSNRFDGEDDFDFGGIFSDPPSGWKAWAGAPRQNMFNIAFALNPDIGRIGFDIGEPDTFASRSVRTNELPFPGIPLDNTTQSTHAIRYNGQVIVEAREHQPNDGDISIRFVGLCRNSANTRLQGYLNIYSAVSGQSAGQEGYHVMYVSKRQRINILPPAEVPDLEPPVVYPVRLLVEPLADTLHRVVTDGVPQLLADVKVDIQASENAKAADLQVEEINLIAGGPDGLRQPRELNTLDLKAQTGEIKDIPVLETEGLEMKLASGGVVRASLGGFTLASLPTEETPLRSVPAPQAWSTIAGTAGASVITPELAKPPQFVPEWQIGIQPVYAGLKEGQLSLEDDSVWAEELNEALENPQAAQMEKLFGGRQPFRITWGFEAVDLSTGETVPVSLRKTAAPRAVQVELLPGKAGGLDVPNAAFKVTFPQQAADTIYELRATVVIRDTLGSSTRRKLTVWSHILPIATENDVDELLRTVAGMAEVSERLLLFSSQLPVQPDPESVTTLDVEDPRLRRARMLRVAVVNSAIDGRISLGELKLLLENAKLFGNKE